jgi:hypothetical protein
MEGCCAQASDKNVKENLVLAYTINRALVILPDDLVVSGPEDFQIAVIELFTLNEGKFFSCDEIARVFSRKRPEALTALDDLFDIGFIRAMQINDTVYYYQKD